MAICPNCEVRETSDFFCAECTVTAQADVERYQAERAFETVMKYLNGQDVKVTIDPITKVVTINAKDVNALIGKRR